MRIDVAALFAAAILRRRQIIPFDTRAYDVRIDPASPILSVGQLANYGGGGTDCSIRCSTSTAGPRSAVRRRVLVSDNQSWVYRDVPFAHGRQGETGVLSQWQTFAVNQRRLGVGSPKLVCIDIQPYGSTQAPDRDDILNVGGFSDAVFNTVASFLSGDAARFVAEVEAIEL